VTINRKERKDRKEKSCENGGFHPPVVGYQLVNCRCFSAFFAFFAVKKA
jgi:hypothetical protein